ncbi:MAG TPA: NADH-quinone oxidoreductase subunit N [Chloroflexota bacterium]|nr:NADH-quinone oxidoreductase subunit N [Chloroflexota bacterium]
MVFDINQLNYALVVPDFVLLGLIFVALTLDLFLPLRHKPWIGWVSIVGLVACIATAVPLWGTRANFGGVLRIDEFSIFFMVMFLLTAIGIILISMEYAQRFLPQPGEYYGMVLAGTLGMVLMAQANELLTAYMALELLSFSSYVLVSYYKTNVKSNEAGLKYIILGSVSSAILLYGISLVYGTVGTTYFPDMALAVTRLDDAWPAFTVAMALLMAGLGFKIAAVPFHMWTPDIYEGAPTPVTAYLSVGSKAAGFAFVLRFLVGGLLPLNDLYQVIFAILAVLTMSLGNLVAIRQRNIKRMLAYSSIAQAGYVLVGLASLVDNADIAEMATRGMMLHLLGYIFTNLAAFGAIVAFQNVSGGREQISDMAGFARRAPFVGVAMMAALFSLAGMPLFAGFVTKFYLFTAAARAGLLWLVAVAVINSTISLYYYLLVVYEMYVRTPPGFETDGHGAHAVIDTPASAVASPLMTGYGPPTATLALARTGSSHGYVAVADAPTHTVHTSPGGNGHAAGHNRSASVTPASHGGDGHGGGHDADTGHGNASHGAGTPAVPWWKRDITADMAPEQHYPHYPVSWVMVFALLLFLVGIFWLGLWPAPILDLLQDASDALFVS